MLKGIVSLLLIAGAGVIFFTQTKNYFPEIKEIRGRISVYNKTIETIRNVRSSVDKLLGEYNSISQENIDKVNKMIPSGSESMKLVVQIEDMMKAKGLTLKSIDAKESAKESSVKTKGEGEKVVSPLTLSMKAQGSYQAFYYFMNDLEKSLRLMDIGSVKINAVGDKEIYDFSIEAVSYWRETSK
ncbi:MAG: type 4a pilus biogenesis protein PilO [Patescibacteria group bacterium]